jgi:hypothetical protein
MTVRSNIDVQLIRRLVAAQFPQLSDLPVSSFHSTAGRTGVEVLADINA